MTKTDIWMPFDPNNSTYKWLEKETSVSRKTWLVVASVGISMFIADYLGRKRILDRLMPGSAK